MIHTIGVSFTAEMIAKAAYEETIGRVTAWLRGSRKTPQDQVVAEMAADYAQFLRQTPWYEYPFTREARELWAAPVDHAVRGWERRFGIGLEFQAKAATEPAQLRIRSIVTGLDAAVLSQIRDVTVIRQHHGGLEIETPRYAAFTQILTEIARRGGAIREIAGNDEIMASVTVGDGAAPIVQHGILILRQKRDGIPGDRLLVNVRVPQLAAFLRAYPPGDPGLEHVFDY
jgi:predicted TIM-barrel fold metal-dependent hydrolase